MKKIGFIPNAEKDTDLVYTKKLIDWAFENGCEVLLPANIAAQLNYPIFLNDEEQVYKEADFVVALGGDGTILRVARKASKFETPIIGINLGRLGYLTDVEKNDAVSALTKVLKGDYKVENRMMLDAVITRTDGLSETGTVLNEVCVSNGTSLHMIEISLYVNDEYIDTYKADGIIISTPTGSTAYNLSAGGPILKPDTQLIAITPVCPHTLYSRPSVISGEDVIKVKIHENKSSVVSFDGRNSTKLFDGDIVTIKKSEYATRVIKTNGLGFYDILRRKMYR